MSVIHQQDWQPRVSSTMDRELVQQIERLIRSGKVTEVSDLFRDHPEWINPPDPAFTWLQVVINNFRNAGGTRMVQLLIELGCDVNASGITRISPLSKCLSEGHLELARLLLENGADPNRDRSVIYAITGNKRNCLEMIQLLELHGADLQRCFPLGNTGEQINALSTAISWGKKDVAEYLLSKGASLP